MNNLSNSAKKLDRIFEIVHIVLGALAIACIVGVALIAAAYILKWDPSRIVTGYEKLNIGFLELTIAEAFTPNYWLVMLQTTITLLVCCRLMYEGRKGVLYIRQILQPMAEEKPFDAIVSTNLKKLATLSIHLGILVNIIKLTEQVIAVFVYDLPGLLISEKITNVSGLFEVDLTFLIYWAILLLLSYVFRYGEELQQLSDETL